MMNLKTLAAQVEDRKNEKGFTLIELIIVVAIIGILVAIAIPVYGAIQQNARDKATAAAAKDAATAVVAALSDDDPLTTSATATANYDGDITITVDESTAGVVVVTATHDNADTAPVSETANY